MRRLFRFGWKVWKALVGWIYLSMVLYKKLGISGIERFFAKKVGNGGYFSFRPGVKRMTDYELIGGYSGYKNEIDIGVTYKKKAFIQL